MRFYKTAHFDFAQNKFEAAADSEDCFQRGPSAAGKPLGLEAQPVFSPTLAKEFLKEFPKEFHMRKG